MSGNLNETKITETKPVLGSVNEAARKGPVIPRIPARFSKIAGPDRFMEPTVALQGSFLNELQRRFAELGTVKRALYLMQEKEKKQSYLIMLDLDVKHGQQFNAINLIQQTTYPYQEFPFRGPCPVEFGLWQDSVAEKILKSNPSLQFFARP